MDKSTLEQLREFSRQFYLEKREEKEMRLLELSMRDEKVTAKARKGHLLTIGMHVFCRTSLKARGLLPPS